MIVADASATVAYLVNQPVGRGVRARQRFASEALHAPHLLDLEVANSLRRLVFRGAITPGEASQALEDLLDLPIVRYPHHPLVARAWELRHNLTAYDAAYVALAEALGAALVTLDSGIRDAPGHRAMVEVL